MGFKSRWKVCLQVAVWSLYANLFKTGTSDGQFDLKYELISHNTEMKVSLNAEYLPQYVINIDMNNSKYILDLSSQNDIIRDYKMSISVEKMNCFEIGDGQRSPLLVIQGDNKTLKLCSKVDNEMNGFQSVEHLMDNVYGLKVTTEGNWTHLGAKLVASIYYEVADSCDNCAEDYFCCGNKRNPCSERTKNTNRMSRTVFYRCIPKVQSKGETNLDSLICNRHPNCGFYCNLDESAESCRRQMDSCATGSYCDSVVTAIEIAVIVLLVFCLPPILFYLICRRKSSSSLVSKTGDAPHGITNEFTDWRNSESSIDGESLHDQPTTATSTTDSHPEEFELPTIYNPANDLPPPYEEYCNKDENSEVSEDPPPYFEELTEKSS